MRDPVAIVRYASWLVPEEQRAEWLAEWHAELWYIGREIRASLRQFCTGAFWDALWIRRSSIAERSWWRWTSPLTCLGSLGLAAITLFSLALLLPAPGGSGGNPRPAASLLWQGQSDVSIFVPILILSLWAYVINATLSSCGNAPGRSDEISGWRRFVLRGGKRMLFFTCKIALLLAAAFSAAADVAALLGFWALGVGVIFGYTLAVHWALVDQRNRCPKCLRLLDEVREQGSLSCMFLEPCITEFTCAKGHGALHVPQVPTASFRRRKWVVHEDSPLRLAGS